jgi:HEAT repeat protein
VKLREAGLQTRLEGASYPYLPGGVRSDPLQWPARVGSKWDAVIVALCGIVEHPDQAITSVLEADPSLAARCAASGVLLDPETHRRMIERLVESLRDGGGRVSVAMAHAIQRFGDSAAAPGLVAILRGGPRFANSSLDAREAAAVALAGCSGPIAVAGLIEALGSDSKAVRIRAIRSLGEIGDASVVPHLSGILWDDNSVPIFFSTTSTSQGEAVRSLIRIGERAPQAVIPVMLDGLRSPDPRIRTASARVLGSVSDRSVVRGLLDALVFDVDSAVRYASYAALRQFRDVGAVPELLQGLRHSDARARTASAEGLGSIGDRSGVGGLLDALAYDVDPRVRTEAAKALGAIGDLAAVPGLLDAFRCDPDVDVLNAASTALIRFRDPRVVSALLDGLRDPDSSKRRAAAGALAELADVAAISVLLEAVGDESVQVRDYAGFALARIGRPAVPGLIQVLDSLNPLARRQAAVTLKAIGDDEAIPALERRCHDEDRGVAQAAADAITALRGARAGHDESNRK